MYNVYCKTFEKKDLIIMINHLKTSAFRMSFKIQYSIYPPQAYFKVYTEKDISSFSILKRVELSQFS